LGLEQALLIVAAGAVAFGLASLLWALRVSDGARGATAQYRKRMRELEDKIARADSLFSAHPGIVLVWGHDNKKTESSDSDPDSLTDDPPKAYGSAVALASLLNFTDQSITGTPASRILEGLADLEARDGTGGATTLRERLTQLRREGAPFSLTMIAPGGRFLEADGRTAGARAVLWLSDSTIKGLEESSARGRLEETRQLIARDPVAFLDMVSQLPFPAWRLSSGGKLQWANAAYLKLVEAGSLDEGIQSQTLIDTALLPQSKKAIETGQPVEEIRKVTVEGKRRAMRLCVFPITGGTGGFALDEEEHQQARADLDIQKRTHDATLDHVSDGVIIFDSKKQIVFSNAAVSELFKIDPAKLRRLSTHGEFLDHLRERNRLIVVDVYAAWRAEELSQYESLAELPEAMWTLTGGRTLRVTKQRHPLGGLVLLFRDITDEMSLRASYSTLIKVQVATLNSLHEGVAVFGSDGRLRLHNAVFKQMWGFASEDLADEPYFTVVDEVCARQVLDPRDWDHIRDAVIGRAPEKRGPMQHQLRAEGDRYINYLIQPLPDGATLVAFADQTADQRVQSALKDRADAFQAADQLKDDFVQNVSYQLRTPLTTILGYGEFLESEMNGSLTSVQQSYVRSILSSAMDLTKLIDNVLDIAMIDAGRSELNLGDVDLASVFRETVDMSATNAEATQVKFDIDLPKDLPPIRADEKRIRQILFNLVSNAMRFCGPGNTITLKAEQIDTMMRMSVSDNGRGIEYTRQAAAFESFVSGDRSGVGLGLALVRAFTQQHGGLVTMTSEPGEGTEVVCLLPIQASPRHATPELTLH
jgi:signal transduction histidine kinase